MQIIGDSIQIGAPGGRRTILQRDTRPIEHLARQQSLDGTDALCLSLGPLLRDGAPLVAMPMDGHGISRLAHARLALLTETLPVAFVVGATTEYLIVDPMVAPLAGGRNAASRLSRRCVASNSSSRVHTS